MPEGSMRTVLAISGMRDNDCRERVCRALGRVNGVKDVSVSLIRARAVVEHHQPCDPAELVRAVTGAGYGATLDGMNGNGRPRVR